MSTLNMKYCNLFIDKKHGRALVQDRQTDEPTANEIP